MRPRRLRVSASQRHGYNQATLTPPAARGADMRKIGYPVFELFFGALLLFAALLVIFKTVISLIK
jgi:hypothetical protein